MSSSRPTTAASFQVRAARPEDGPALREVVRSVLLEYGLPPEPGSVDADLDDVHAFYVTRGGTFDVVVDAHGAVVGTMGLLPLGEGRCELRKMYLAARARGLGLGKLLLQRAIDEARRRGFSRLELETAAPLVEARALYERSGFVRVERPIAVSRCDRAYELTL